MLDCFPLDSLSDLEQKSEISVLFQNLHSMVVLRI